MSAIGGDYAMKELFGPRADSNDAKADLYKQISMYGYAYMKDLSNNLDEKRTLNTTEAFLIGSGIETDLLKDDRV